MSVIMEFAIFGHEEVQDGDPDPQILEDGAVAGAEGAAARVARVTASDHARAHHRDCNQAAQGLVRHDRPPLPTEDSATDGP